MTISKPPFIDILKFISLFFLAPVMLMSCATAAYEVQERFGIEKRDILVDRVASAARSQTEAKEEFVDALTAFRAVVTVDGGELENAYDNMSKAYDRAESKAGQARGPRSFSRMGR